MYDTLVNIDPKTVVIFSDMTVVFRDMTNNQAYKEAMTQFVECWHDMYADGDVTTAEILDACNRAETEEELCLRSAYTQLVMLREVRGGKVFLGTALTRFRGDNLRGLFIDFVKNSSPFGSTWAVKRLEFQ